MWRVEKEEFREKWVLETWIDISGGLNLADVCGSVAKRFLDKDSSGICPLGLYNIEKAVRSDPWR
jgi:hypothetical protein